MASQQSVAHDGAALADGGAVLRLADLNGVRLFQDPDSDRDEVCADLDRQRVFIAGEFPDKSDPEPTGIVKGVDHRARMRSGLIRRLQQSYSAVERLTLDAPRLRLIVFEGFFVGELIHVVLYPALR